MDRLKLIDEVYDHVFGSVDTFEEEYDRGETPIGADLAYLLGAIARGNRVEFSARHSLWWLLVDPEHGLPRGHPVWQFVHADMGGDWPANYTIPGWVTRTEVRP
jgi:hypothetical protein